MEFTGRQKEIVEKAMKIMNESGVEKLTTKNLAASLGVTEPALYRHFRGKRQILEAMLENFHALVGDSIRKARDTGTVSLDRIRSLLHDRCREFSDSHDLTLLVFSEELFAGHTGLSERVAEIVSLNRAFIVETVREGQGRGEIRRDVSSEILADLILGPFRLTVSRWRMSGFRSDLVGEFGRLWPVLEKIMGSGTTAGGYAL